MISPVDILNAGILIVDDLEANVRLLEQILHGVGYTCVASTMDPLEVCELHRKNGYDLILLDLQMPGMNGFQVMEGLKAIETGGYIPVLVITAQPGHKLRALAAGAKDFISKPFDLVEVKTRIHNMLEVRLLYKKIEKYNKALEQTVQERTGELTRVNEQLSQEIEECKEDIPLLVDYFVAKFNKKTGKKIETVEKETLNVLQEYDWPGNVRELESIVERAVITSQGTALQILDRFVNSLKAGEQEALDGKALVDIERDHIFQTLEKTGWRIEGKKGAAAILGLNPSTLRGRMRKDGIRR